MADGRIVLRSVPITELPQAQVQVSATFDLDEFLGDRSLEPDAVFLGVVPQQLGNPRTGRVEPADSALNGELAFSRLSRVRDDVTTAEVSGKRVEAVPVFTSFNGLIPTNLVFQGVVSDGADVDGGKLRLGYRSKDMSLTASGTRGIYNTSGTYILAGQDVYWRFPDQRNRVPVVSHDDIADSPALKNKFIACVTSESFSGTNVAGMTLAEYNRHLGVNPSGPGVLMPEEVALLEFYADNPKQAWRLIDTGRRIGKATTSAPKGYPFMVNLM